MALAYVSLSCSLSTIRLGSAANSIIRADSIGEQSSISTRSFSSQTRQIFGYRSTKWNCISPSLNFFPLRSHKNKGQADETKRIEAEGRNSQFISQEKKKKIPSAVGIYMSWWYWLSLVATSSFLPTSNHIKSERLCHFSPNSTTDKDKEDI